MNFPWIIFAKIINEITEKLHDKQLDMNPCYRYYRWADKAKASKGGGGGGREGGGLISLCKS